MSNVTMDQAQSALTNALSSSKSTSARKLDMLDQAGDLVTQASQQVESAYTLCDQNSTVIQQFASDQMVADLMNKSMDGFIGEARKVLDALGTLQQIHPFVAVPIIAFRAVVGLELTRRENDRKVCLMLVKACDMMNILLQLKDTKDPDIVGPRGKVRGRLDGVLSKIKKNVEDCGNAIDKYYKSKFIVKFFRSSHWATEFLTISGSFSQRMQELHDALAIRTALGVDIAIKKLEELTQMLSEREEKSAKGVQMRVGMDVYFESEREKIFAKEVHMCGGLDSSFENEDKLAGLVKVAKKQEERPQNQARPDASSKDVNKSPSQVSSANGSIAEQYRIDASLLHELRTPISSLLDENRSLFMFKLNTQTSIIQDTIKDSETRLMWAFNSSYRRVKDAHLQYIWKEMKWKTSVKTLYFTAELHDYFMHRFSHQHHNAPQPQATSDTSESSLVVRAPSPAPSDATCDSERESTTAYRAEPPPIDPADKWCLKYLSVFYIPSLSEGFDSDANGLVSIMEVNAFTSAMPSGWSLPQALAYWAAGWRVDSQHYHARIEQVLNSMVYAQEDVLPENRRGIALYLDSYVINGVKRLVRSLAELGSENLDLDLARLAEPRRNAQEKILADKLSIVKYEVDSKDSIQLFGTGRIEDFLLPLLYLVTRRHLQIMKLAKTVILVDRELECATQTIANILEAVDLRVEQLAESFRQQGNDPKARFTWYAHGLYNFWYSPERTTDDAEYWGAHDFGTDDTELEIDATALKLGPSNLTKNQELFKLEKPVNLTASNPDQQPEDTKGDYIRLWCMNELRNQRNLFPLEMPSYLSPEEQQRFKSLSEKLPEADVQRWSSLAELQVRRRLFPCCCNACHSLITDVYHRCIDCEDDSYDLCAECESLPVSSHKYPSNHKATHNMVVFRMVLPYGRCSRVRWYAKNFFSTILPPAAPSADPSAAQEDKSQIQSDGSEFLLPTQAFRVDNSSAFAGSREGGEKLNGNTGAIAETSVANGDVYTCAECGIKMKGIVFYVCLTCGELHSETALCSDCAFRDAFNVVTGHLPHKHWLVKVKDRVQDMSLGTLDEDHELLDKVDETTSLSFRVDRLAAMVESRFVEQDLRLSALLAQVDQLMQGITALAGKAHLTSESVTV